MKQKIIKIGNAHGVIIPKKLLEEAGLKPGELVFIEKDAESYALRLADKPRTKSPITSKFLKILDEVNSKYDSALRKLAEL